MTNKILYDIKATVLVQIAQLILYNLVGYSKLPILFLKESRSLKYIAGYIVNIAVTIKCM